MTEPVTSYYEATSRYRSSLVARERFEELTTRDLMATAQATLQARGEFDQARHGDPDKYAPLTPDERLEVLAIGELLARTYRWSGYVGYALEAGATWLQVADALGGGPDDARRDYRAYIDGQRQLWIDYAGKFGLDDAEYAKAVRRCSE